jgi:hypothetical protein
VPLAIDDRPRTELVTVPAQLVEAVRDGVYAELRTVALGVAEATETPGHSAYPMRYQEHRERFNAACALLDAIGWASAPATADAQVDLTAHRTVLLAAVAGAREDAADALEDVTTRREKDPHKRELITERSRALGELASRVEAQARELKPRSEARP